MSIIRRLFLFYSELDLSIIRRLFLLCPLFGALLGGYFYYAELGCFIDMIHASGKQEFIIIFIGLPVCRTRKVESIPAEVYQSGQ